MWLYNLFKLKKKLSRKKYNKISVKFCNFIIPSLFVILLWLKSLEHMLLSIVFKPIRHETNVFKIILHYPSILEPRMFELSTNLLIVFLSINRGFRKGADFFSTYQDFRLIAVSFIEVPLYLPNFILYNKYI